MLTFSHHLYPFSLLVHSSSSSSSSSILVFLSRSIAIPHIPTGVVIPSPQWRLNDFILPRPWLLLLMMCLVPSYFDADYQSLLVCACVGSRGVGIGGNKNWGKKKKKTWMNWYKSAVFHVLSACFPVISALPFWNPSCLMIAPKTWSLERSSGAVSPTDIPQKTALLFLCFREVIVIVSPLMLPIASWGGFPSLLTLAYEWIICLCCSMCFIQWECWLKYLLHEWI